MGRPIGVTILAVIGFFFGGCFVLGAIGMMLGGAVLANMARGGGGFGVLAGVGGAVIGIILLGLAALYIIDAIGLLKLKNWARILTIILVGLSLLRAAFVLLGSLVHLNVITLFVGACFAAIDVLILVYLFKADVKQAFGATSF